MSVDLVSTEELEKLCHGITAEYDDAETAAVAIAETGEPIALIFDDKRQIIDLIEKLSELLDDRAELGTIVKGQIVTLGEIAAAESLAQLELLRTAR